MERAHGPHEAYATVQSQPYSSSSCAASKWPVDEVVDFSGQLACDDFAGCRQLNSRGECQSAGDLSDTRAGVVGCGAHRP